MTLQVPADMHGHVLGLTWDLVRASEQGDRRTWWRLYGELKQFCEAEAGSGRDHPFLWESLADFTHDDGIAIDLYLRALGLADQLGDSAYGASIRLELARRCLNMDAIDRAYDYALEADRLARGLEDLELRRDISQFLLDQSATA